MLLSTKYGKTQHTQSDFLILQQDCQNFHCDHCIYINKKTTNEYSISPDIQCKISDIEHKIGEKLVKNLEKKAKEEEEMNNL